jgi:hypothetical protein
MASAPRTALNETKDGAFVRTDAGFRNQIKPDVEFPPEGVMLWRSQHAASVAANDLVGTTCGLHPSIAYADSYLTHTLLMLQLAATTCTYPTLAHGLAAACPPCTSR